jgi:hypothetical protein
VTWERIAAWKLDRVAVCRTSFFIAQTDGQNKSRSNHHRCYARFASHLFPLLRTTCQATELWFCQRLSGICVEKALFGRFKVLFVNSRLALRSTGPSTKDKRSLLVRVRSRRGECTEQPNKILHLTILPSTDLNVASGNTVVDLANQSLVLGGSGVNTYLPPDLWSSTSAC